MDLNMDDFYEQDDDDFHDAHGDDESDFFMGDDDNDVDHDVDLVFQQVSHTTLPKPINHIDFSCYSRQDILKMLDKEIAHISDLCGVEKSAARTLLLQFRWNKERLLERYMEDSDKVLRESGIIIRPEGQATEIPGVIISTASKDFSCSICCDDAEDDATLQVAYLPTCKHQFCTTCYSYYVVQKIRGEGECRKICCPATNCTNTVNEEAIKQLIVAGPSGISDDAKKTLSVYESLVLKTFVDDMENLKWCPAPNCETVVKCEVLQSQLKHIVPTVKCSTCNHVFCFGCSLPDHEPCICALARAWLKKCEDDSETSNWIAANTKECTKCRYTIEKNGGCNHMTCKNCKYEFCWVCSGPWTEHGNNFYNCNRFDEKSSLAAREQQAKSRSQLERYLHYFNRYNNHKQSIKLANDYYSRTEKKMEEMQLTSEFSWIDVQFIKKALEVVNECRHTLKWTYAFAFYLKSNNMSVLFEDNQRDLEVAVESLNELIEQPLPSVDDKDQNQKLADLKQLCLDKTEYCSRRRKVVLDDTARGLQEERWMYNIDMN